MTNTENTAPAFEIVTDPGTGELTTQCPHCGELGTINEKDIAIRWNRLTIHQDENGSYGTASTGDHQFDADGWVCSDCIRDDIVAPDSFEITAWS